MSLNKLTKQNFQQPQLNPRFNSLVVDNEIIAYGQTTLIYSGSGIQTIANNSIVPITCLQTLDYSQGNDISFNPTTGIITCNVSGHFMFTYSIEWASSSVNGSPAKCGFFDNKTSVRYLSSQISSSSTNTLNSNCSGLINMTAGQSLTFFANQTSGANQNIGSNSSIALSPNSLCIYRLVA